MSARFEIIDSLKSEWDRLQPLAPENERRLWQKLRLEWNYHSNHIEGNTLTYGETALLLLHGQTAGHHTLREYEEMKAHDVGIAHLRVLAADKSRLIGEGDIRDLNKIILKEPYWKAAQTSDGRASRKQIVPGEYKTTPNNVLTATGALFEFAPPAEVPARMQALVVWLAECLREGSAHPVAIAAGLHHGFVLIHPFDDGNGRVARMLVNYLFLLLDFPPVIVPTEQKAAYLTSLRLADAGDLEALGAFLARQMERSLALAIRAGRGESVDEPGDLEKEIALFVRSQDPDGQEVRPRSGENIRRLYETGFKTLFSTAAGKMRAFDPLFVRTTVTTEPGGVSSTDSGVDLEAAFERLLTADFKGQHRFDIRFHLQGYTGAAAEPFSLETWLRLRFEEFAYSVLIDNERILTKRYSEPLPRDEIDHLAEHLLRGVFDGIKRETAD